MMDSEYIALKNYLDLIVNEYRPNLQKVLMGVQKVFNAEILMIGYTMVYNKLLGQEQQSGQIYDLFGTYNKAFLKESLQYIKDSKREFLCEFIKQHQYFEYFTKHQFNYFNYLDRTYVQLTNGKLKLKEFSKFQFECELLREIREQLVVEFLIKLQETRQSEDKQNQLLLQRIFDIVNELKKWSFEFYISFKNQIFAESAKYYEKKYGHIEMNNSIYECIFLIKEFCQKENKIYDLIFRTDEDFIQQLKNSFNDLVLKQLKHKICESNNDYLDQIFEEERFTEFTIMVDLFSQLNDQLNGFKQKFYLFLISKSNSIIQKFSQFGLHGIQKLQNDKHQIEELIQHQQKYIKIIENHAGNNSILRSQLSSSIECSLNQSEQSVMEGLLTYFDDIIAHKNNIQEEKTMKVAMVFKCFPQKDIFIKNYQVKLQKRLILTKKTQLDDEKFIVNQIGLICGPEHVKDLEIMLKDLENEQNAYINYNSKYNVVIQPYILNQLVWPQPRKNLSQEFTPLIPLKEEFLDHYLNLNANNRQRNVKYHDEYSELVLQFTTDQTYKVTVSVPQAQILYLFQYQNLGLREELLNARLNFPEDCNQNIQQLIKNKLLIENEGLLQFNTNFSSKKIQFRVAMIFNERIIAFVNMNHDRDAAIEAAIVRIMKSRKKLSFTELSAQVKKNLKMFEPKDVKIKEIIEKLIFKDFLARDPDKMSELIYVS